jgi:hypothetical protein
LKISFNNLFKFQKGSYKVKKREGLNPLKN